MRRDRFIIYCHTHIATGRRYVGQTSRTLQWRWAHHVDDALRGGHGCPVFAAAIRKYGPDSFAHDILEEVEGQHAANTAEIKWVAYFDCLVPHGFNIDAGGGVSPRSESTRQKIRWARWTSLSPEQQRANVQNMQAGLTPEVCRRRTRTQIAALSSEQRKARMSEALEYWLGLTFDQRSQLTRDAKARVPPEERSASARKAAAAQSPEQRRARGLKAAAALSPEQLEEKRVRAQQAWADPLQRAVRVEGQRAAWARLSPEQRKARGRKSVEAQTPEQLRERARKTWETRRKLGR